MRSRTPKMLHRICGRPLIAYPLRLARTMADRVVMVVGPGSRRHPGGGRQRRGDRGAAGAPRDRPRRAAGPRGLRRRPPAPSWSCRETCRCCLETARAAWSSTTCEPRGRDAADRGGRGSHRLWPRGAGAGPAVGRSSSIATRPRRSGRSARSAPASTASTPRASGPRWPGHARQRAGRVLPHRRDRHPARRAGAVEAVITDDPSECLGVNDRRQLARWPGSCAGASSTG